MWQVFLLLGLVWGGGAAASGAVPTSAPAPKVVPATTAQIWPAWLTQGETLVYDVSLLGKRIGRADFHLQPLPQNKYQLTLRAWTMDFWDKMYFTRDRWVVTGRHRPGQPFLTERHHIHLQERDDQRQREAVFDRTRHQVTYRNLLAQPVETQLLPMVPLTRDIISALYALRAQTAAITAGGVWTLPVHDLDDGYQLQVQADGQERVKTKAGTFNTWRLKLRLTHTTKADEVHDHVTLWVTDDAARVPVRISRALPLGRFVAELRGVGPVGLGVDAPVGLGR